MQIDLKMRLLLSRPLLISYKTKIEICDKYSMR